MKLVLVELLQYPAWWKHIWLLIWFALLWKMILWRLFTGRLKHFVRWIVDILIWVWLNVQAFSKAHEFFFSWLLRYLLMNLMPLEILNYFGCFFVFSFFLRYSSDQNSNLSSSATYLKLNLFVIIFFPSYFLLFV